MDGWGVWEVLDVPAAVAPLVHAAVIVADANVAGFGSKLVRQAAEGVARNVLRKQIRDEARRVAQEGLERVARKLDTLDAYEHLPAAERQVILDRAEMAMERAYGQRLARHAGAEADAYERTLASLDGRLDEQAEHLRKIARENAEGYRDVQEAAADALQDRLPDATPVPRSLGAMSRAERLARKMGMNIESPTTRQILNNIDMPVADFIAKFRKGSIKSRFPREFLDQDITMEHALLQGGSTVRKLLTDSRFVK